MPKPQNRTMSVSQFRSRCFEVVDQVARGKVERIVLTKRGEPIAALIRYVQRHPKLHGAMTGTVSIAFGVDIAEPTGEVWEAERDD